MDAKEDKSIIDPKYRGKYKLDKDWLSKLIDKQAVETVTKEKTVTAEDGTETTEIVNTTKTRLNLDKLFDLAEENHIKARELYGDQIDRKNAAGRLRMTLANSLRAAAKHRHGLFVDGQWVDAPEDFLGDHEKTQHPDGTKIAKAKPTEDEAEAEAA